jgi:P-type conjugative transfer protein TrbG
MKAVPILFLVCVISADAQDLNPGLSQSITSPIGGENPALNIQQAAGVGITRQWEEKSYQAMVQVPGQDGSIQFHYGQSLPTIVCAVLQVTDVELQPGEIVNECKLGDTERWAVEPAVSGDATKTEHLIIKPKDIGLQTSLVVTTDHRTYHLELLSDAREYMHHVLFLYQDAPVVAAVPTASPKPAKETPVKPLAARSVKVALEESSRPSKRSAGKPSGKEAVFDAKDVDDGYVIKGKAPWTPLSAYNDGKHTYIEMPKGMAKSEAPALFVLKKGGPLGLGSQKTLVNYRVKPSGGKSWYVVDNVIDRAALVVGVGGSQDKATIVRKSQTSSSSVGPEDYRRTAKQ